jgi:HPt (histidine-containing phosphotransfer) domain-containing protein
MKTFVARIDSDLSDLIPEFLAHKRSDTSVILSALSNGDIDFDTLARIGHKLKGEGGSYGLDDISVYGAEIEAAAHNHDAAALRRCAGELAEYLDSVRIEYE